MYPVGLSGELLAVYLTFQTIRENDADMVARFTDGAYEPKSGDVHGVLVWATARVRLVVSPDCHSKRPQAMAEVTSSPGMAYESMSHKA